MKIPQRQIVLFGLLAASATAVAWDHWGHKGAGTTVVSEAAPRRASLAAPGSTNGTATGAATGATTGSSNASMNGSASGTGISHNLTISASPQDGSTRVTASSGQILALRGRQDYQQAGGDVFPSLAPAAPPPPPPAVAAEPARPTAPALPFTVIGKKFEAGQWEVFLARGDQTLVASVGTQLGSDYRVSAITGTQMTLVYLPLQENQTLPIGAAFND